MSITPNPRHDASPEDAEILRKLYEDQLRDYRAELTEANRVLQETAEAHKRFLEANDHRAYTQGQIDALRMLAARDGVTLSQ